MSQAEASAKPYTEDNKIVEVAEELCGSLGFDYYKPKAIRWVTWLIIPHGRLIGNLLVPSDQCFFENNDVALAKTLKGRLTPSEWAPLIASSLIHEFDKGIRRRLAAMRPLRFAPVFAAISLPLILLRLSLPGFQLPIIPTFAAVMLSLLLISIFFWDFSLARKRLRLSCDRRALMVVDKETFLKTLFKIDAMGLSDVESRKREKPSGWSLNRTEWPSITQRIANLQSV